MLAAGLLGHAPFADPSRIDALAQLELALELAKLLAQARRRQVFKPSRHHADRGPGKGMTSAPEDSKITIA